MGGSGRPDNRAVGGGSSRRGASAAPTGASAVDRLPASRHDPTTGEVETLAARLVREWPGGEQATVRLHTVSENATFLVDGPARRTVLRVHRVGYHDRSAVASELMWLGALASVSGVRVAGVVSARDGRRVVEGRDGAGRLRSAVMFEHLAGVPPPPHDPDAFERIGELTGRLHHHARHWAPPAGFRRFSWDVETTIGPNGRWGRWEDAPGVGAPERALLERLAVALRARLDAYGRDADRFGLIHADLRPANLLVDGGVTGVIDFDDCGYGWLLYDLAAAVSFSEDHPAVPELMDRWVTGYRRVRTLPAADEAELWTFVLLRRLLLLAWIGSHAWADEAVRLGAGFTAGTCELAERYLAGRRPPGGRRDPRSPG